MQFAETFSPSDLFQLGATIPIGGWPREQSPEQSLEVKWRAADEQHFTATTANLPHGVVCKCEVLCNAEIFPRIDDIDEMMRNSLTLGRARLRRADVHAAIDGHRIERDDLRIDPPGQFNSDGRFPAGGRTGQDHQGQGPATGAGREESRLATRIPT